MDGALRTIGMTNDTDAPRIDWVPVASYAARYEVDIPLRVLENAGIPAVVRGEEAGIWGPGFTGPTSQGITLLVPKESVEEAQELLEID